MRIILLINNWVGWQVTKFLLDNNEPIVGIIMHPQSKQSYGCEISDSLKDKNIDVFDASDIHSKIIIEKIRALQPNIALSIYFGYILKPIFLELFPDGIVNLHPSYLPYNRGAYPNVWSIIEQTPIGATLHYIDSGIDTGDIIAQQLVNIEPIDTGETLYRKLEKTCLDLFTTTWPSIKAQTIIRQPQPNDIGTHHYRRDIQNLDEIDLDRLYKARDLINLLRARTFSPHNNAYFVENGRRVNINISLSYHEDYDR